MGAPVALRVSRAFSVDVAPLGRAREYVALPVDEYAVLDASAVRRVGDGRRFRVSAGRQKFMFLDVEPVGTIEVARTADGCVQSLVGAEILDRGGGRGATLVASVNASLRDVRLRNEVSATRTADGGEAIRCRIDIEGEFTEGAFARVGESMNAICAWSLRAVMPWFLTRLAADYERWARGEPRDADVERANLASIAAKIIAGSRGRLPDGVRECELDAA